jgi:hypothetical protein
MENIYENSTVGFILLEKKTEYLNPAHLGNRYRMSVPTTYIQHCTGLPKYCDKTRQRKGIQIVKKIKLLL